MIVQALLFRFKDVSRLDPTQGGLAMQAKKINGACAAIPLR
ncbi:hypothetical protein ABAC460_01265 [Asticcacaulis sp. AC460]|nr:hypothetical protein ABAC460_01265 [Asticcacaulis sp. AC460]